MHYVIGIDIGGTCTDCVVIDAGGRVTLGKAFSTPPDFSRGIIDAVAVTAQSLGLSAGELLAKTRLFLHSTTVAENAVVDGTLATAGVITTRGFEDTLFAMRGGYGRWSGLTEDEKRNPVETDKPAPIVPRSLIRGITERTDAHGRILVAADPDEIRATVQDLLDQGIEALGVSLLWSFANPETERLVGRIIRELNPDLFVTLSHEIAPIVGEYERTSTTALNARLGPVVRRYLNNLRDQLHQHGFRGRLLVMQAHGGLVPLDQAAASPVGMIESGPVSGVVGCRQIGERIGFRNIIAADMGGTTFKVGVVRDGLIEYQRESMVLRYHYALPKLDVVSLGLAGGSIISVDPRTGVPQIGPRSAGSYPGPVCYDHGGEDPTITDVDAILGYLNPTFFLDGRKDLNIEKARAVFKEKVADPLGMDVIQAAGAIYRLANSMIYDLLHKTTVQRGLDPRQFVLFSFGGTAGMHVAAYGEELGVSHIIIPHSASVHGAFGLITSDIVHEDQTTRPVRWPASAQEIDGIFRRLQERVLGQLRDNGFADEDIRLDLSIDMRYRRQVHILTAPLALGGDTGSDGAPAARAGGVVTTVTGDMLERTVDRFESLYQEKYGRESAYRDAGIELVTFRVRGTGIVRKPEFRAEEPTGTNADHAVVETRQAWVAKEGKMQEVRGYAFERLRPGNEVPGPAIIWTPITTVVVNPGQVARLDEYRNLILTRRER